MIFCLQKAFLCEIVKCLLIEKEKSPKLLRHIQHNMHCNLIKKFCTMIMDSLNGKQGVHLGLCLPCVYYLTTKVI